MTDRQSTLSRKYPLSVMLTASNRELVAPDTLFELGVTVHNVGDRSAVIYVFIEERTPILRQWCRSMQERLALAPDQSGEITFQVDIPTTALPDTLEYDLVVDGSDSYQDFPPQRYDRYQLQVLPAAREIAGAEEPSFYLNPASESRQPLVIQPGVSQLLQLWVDNRAERVDRFRLECIGLPQDWTLEITYPTDTEGFGLLAEAQSLGLNPGDRGQILVTFTPPLDALAGIYVPTLRVLSENQPEMSLLDLVYFQVNPNYQLQPLLQILRSQVRTQPALFEVQLENLGNTPRQVLLAVDNLDDPDSCTYTLDDSEVAIAPFKTQRVLLQGEPQKWWQRPLFGGGRLFNFRVALQDPDGHPIAMPMLPGNLLWLPRPWWHLLILVLALLGTLASLFWLIWWLLLRPPVLPQLLTFEAEDSRYSEANQEFARVSWDIFQSHRIEALELTGLSPEGEIISSPLTFTFPQGNLPQALQPFCTQQARQLTCTNVRTNASRPGTYQFKLTVIPKGRSPRQPITAQSSSVVIEPKPIVSGTILEFMPSRLSYIEPAAAAILQDAPSQPEDVTDTIVGPQGILLNWIVENPQELAAMTLVARDGEDTFIGEVQFEFALDDRGDLMLPEILQNTCELEDQFLVCRDVPTEITQVGSYQFELTGVPRTPPPSEGDGAGAEPIPVTTELVAIAPIAPIIARFQINGEAVQPKYLLPVSPGEPPPVIVIDWQVLGGATTTVELLPVPGPVSLEDAAALPLNPAGSTLITLQATNHLGETTARSVQIETFNPNPQDPAAAAAAAAAAATAGAAAMQDDGASSSEAGGLEALEPDRVAPGQIAPIDEPVQFD